MKENDNAIEKLTTDRIKKLGLDEPSADFTNKVMQLVVSEQPSFAAKQRNYWWLLAFVPVLVGIIWYSIIFFHLTGYISHLWNVLAVNVQVFVITNISSVGQFRHISLPSYILFGFIAILALLTIEELISRAKHIH